MKKSYTYLLWGISLGLFLSSIFIYYLDSLEARILLLLIVLLGGFLIYFSLRFEVTILPQVIMVFLLLLLPFSQTGPIKILNSNTVSNEFLLFNHEVKYDVNKGMLIFGEGHHHTNYPLSYILSMVFYEMVPNVYINEFLLYLILITLCYFLLISYLIDKREFNLKTIMITYGIVVLSLSEIQEGRLFWWVYSVGFLNLVITLFSFKKLKEKRHFIVPLLLLISIIMSQSLLPIYLIMGTAFAYYLTKRQAFLTYFKLASLSYSLWQIIITGLKTYITYTGYVPFLWQYLNAFIRNILSPLSVIQKSIIERELTLPLFDRWLFVLSYAIIYIVCPIVLFYLLLKYEKLRLRDLVIPYFVLALGILLQISSRLVPTEYFASITDIVTYGFFPVMMLIFALCLSAKKGSFRIFKQFNKWASLMIIIIVVFGSLNSISLIYPKSVKDSMTFIEDDRITYSNTIQLANYLNLYWNGQLLYYYQCLSHIFYLSLNEDIYDSQYTLHSNEWIVMIPGMSSIYSSGACALNYSRMKYVNIIYNQGPWLLSFVT